MPSKLIQNQDYLNCRYIKKKAIYLSYIAAIVNEGIAMEKKFTGDALRPILKIIPVGKLSKKVVVNVHISLEEGAFKLNRFLPEKNNIRPNWLFQKDIKKGDNSEPTPYFNSIMLGDLIMTRINAESIQKIKAYPNLRDGIILLKVWLKQRQLINGSNTFNGHIVTMYILYLLQLKKLNTYMSSYQIVRIVWSCFAQSDWTEQGITMCTNKEQENNVIKYKEHYDCVFLDNTGYHNFAAFISKDTFFWIKREAEMSLNHLDNAYIDSFQSLFMKKIPFYLAFDHLIIFHNSENLETIFNTNSIKDKIDLGKSKRSQVVGSLTKFLQKGLGHRIHRICVSPCKPKEWKCTEKVPCQIDTFLIGLELNPDFCFGVVDKGPEANLPEAAEFREFWSIKSELRRFQDGSIREAVPWGKGKTLYARRVICKKIVNFILTEKLHLSMNDYNYISDQVDEVLLLKAVKVTNFAYGTGEEATLKVIQAFDALEKEVTSLNDIPLSVNGIHGSSPVIRYAEVFPPLATNYKPNITNIKEGKYYLKLNETTKVAPRYVQPIEASLQLSTSGKWPENLEAIKQTKAAFHIQIAKCLRVQCGLRAQGNYDYIDVFKNGFVFRLRIAHQKEIAFMKQQIGEDGVIKYRDTEESLNLETKLFHLPKLSSALHGLHLQNQSFGAACCITKRWLSAQLLDDSHIPGIAVELLLASMYLIPEPYKPAYSPQVGFLRLLELFSQNNWNTDPIIVNFNNEMSREEIVKVETLFGTSRSTLPLLFISTPYDQQKSLFTRKAPSYMILKRISSLAKASLQLFENQLLSESVNNFKAMFRPPLTDFDCLIRLESAINPRKEQAIDLEKDQKLIHWHPYKEHSKQMIPVIDFDPVQKYLEELRAAYSDFALFFHDTYGGMVIAVLLRPDALKPKEFKLSDVQCHKLDKDGKLVLNVPAMIEDFYILGKDIVKAIEIPHQKCLL
ncbi:nucleolar protein 6 isoform X2 [Prorops nasuta]